MLSNVCIEVLAFLLFFVVCVSVNGRMVFIKFWIINYPLLVNIFIMYKYIEIDDWLYIYIYFEINILILVDNIV
jgi:hypothetical protein